jgi:Arylsulfotransferase (ASST)
MVDDSYREIARIRAGGRWDGDLHEFQLTRSGTALVTKNEAVRRDITAFGGGPNGLVWGGVVQEIALPSGRVLSEWRSLDHIGLDEAYTGPSPVHFDYFHINSIAEDADGHLLVSARNTWAVYKIHRRTGRVIWRLGGRKSDFRMGKGTVTAWQHDARSHDGGRLISIFDNGAAPQVHTQARAILVRLDTERMTATLERAYKHRPGRIVSKFMGNAQVLPDGGVVAGWGSEPFVTEFAPGGAIRFEAMMPHGGQNYRAYRLPWQGTPAVPPRLTRGLAHGKRGIHVSWNGATDVASWQLRYGPSAEALERGPVVPRAGFETYLGPRPAGAVWASVVALDGAGKPIGRTPVRRL